MWHLRFRELFSGVQLLSSADGVCNLLMFNLIHLYIFTHSGTWIHTHISPNNVHCSHFICGWEFLYSVGDTVLRCGFAFHWSNCDGLNHALFYLHAQLHLFFSGHKPTRILRLKIKWHLGFWMKCFSWAWAETKFWKSLRHVAMSYCTALQCC